MLAIPHGRALPDIPEVLGSVVVRDVRRMIIALSISEAFLVPRPGDCLMVQSGECADVILHVIDVNLCVARIAALERKQKGGVCLVELFLAVGLLWRAVRRKWRRGAILHRLTRT